MTNITKKSLARARKETLGALNKVKNEVRELMRALNKKYNTIEEEELYHLIREKKEECHQVESAFFKQVVEEILSLVDIAIPKDRISESEKINACFEYMESLYNSGVPLNTNETKALKIVRENSQWI